MLLVQQSSSTRWIWDFMSVLRVGWRSLLRPAGFLQPPCCGEEGTEIGYGRGVPMDDSGWRHPSRCPLSMEFLVALFIPWCRFLEQARGFSSQVCGSYQTYGALVCYSRSLVSSFSCKRGDVSAKGFCTVLKVLWCCLQSQLLSCGCCPSDMAWERDSVQCGCASSRA